MVPLIADPKDLKAGCQFLPLSLHYSRVILYDQKIPFRHRSFSIMVA